MELHESSESNSTESGKRSRSEVDESPVLPRSFVSIDSFLDSVSIGATAGSPALGTSLLKVRAVEQLDLLIDDDGSADDGSPAQPRTVSLPDNVPLPEPEPEPEFDHKLPSPPPPPAPQTQSRAAALARAQPPAGSVLSSSSDGSDDSSDRPEPGGAVFDVVQEVSCAAWFCLDSQLLTCRWSCTPGKGLLPVGRCVGNSAVSRQENSRVVVRHPTVITGGYSATFRLPVQPTFAPIKPSPIACAAFTTT